MADEGRRKKGKLQSDKRGFSPSTYAPITFQGRFVTLRFKSTKIIQRKYPPLMRWVFSWRRLRDLNPRDGYPPYALSRGASSANLSKSPDEVWYYYEKCSYKRYGGEGGIRTHGSCESLVFKTSSLNHSDTSPYLQATSDIIPPK